MPYPDRFYPVVDSLDWVKRLTALGVSTHDDAELDTALAANPDYVALGPIFFTTLKSMRFAPQGIAKITEWKKRIGSIPLVAIGGIKLEHAAEIFAAGADSIAVVSDVTQNADPDARVRAWLEQVTEAA
jgi:thiamine-phosphate pyrophosphorylase